MMSNVGFTDARLAVLAPARGLPIRSANLRDFSGLRNSFVPASL